MVGEARVPMLPHAPKTVWKADVNDRAVAVLAPSNAVLLDVLRDNVGQLGVKRGCDWARAVAVRCLWTANPACRA